MASAIPDAAVAWALTQQSEIKMTNRKRVFTVAMVFLALFAMCDLADAQTSTSVKKRIFLTNYVIKGRDTAYFVGLEKGYYKEAGFDLEIQPSTGGSFVASALDAERADYGVADGSAIVQAVIKGAKIKAFMVLSDRLTLGLASLKPYPTPQSVIGKTVGASMSDSVRVTLPIVMKLNGLDPSMVAWETADSSLYATLLLSGKVDLMSATGDGDVPTFTKLAEPQGKKIYFSSFADWGYDGLGYMLLTQSKRLEQNPEEVKAFAAATIKAVKYAIANPTEAVKIMIKYNPALDYDITLAQWQQASLAIDTAYAKENGYGIATPDRLQRAIEYSRQAFNVQAPLSWDQIYAPGFVARK